MDVQEFREKGKEMVDYICEYLEKLPKRRVTPNIEPGYLRALLSQDAPLEPEPWESIMKDVESKIMPGNCIFYIFAVVLFLLKNFFRTFGIKSVFNTWMLRTLSLFRTYSF